MESRLATSYLPLLSGIALFTFVSAAHADIIGADPDTDFESSPTTISLDGGVASFTFSYLGSNPDDTTYTVDAVQTGGTGEVASSGFPGPGQQPIPFEDESDVLLNASTFTAFPAPAGIAYSIADDFIGISFVGMDGTHYGYAEVDGPTLVSYAYNSVPGADITTGQAISPVPEPLTLSLFGGGLLGLGPTPNKRLAG